MNETKNSRRTLRTIGAVFAGLITIVVLSIGTDAVMHATGIFPPMFKPMATSLWVLAAAYRAAYNVLGAYLTARLAGNRPIFHIMILGSIGLVLGTVGAVATWNQGPEFGPKWYPLSLIAEAIPFCWAGGKLRQMELRSRATGIAAGASQ